MVIFAAQTYYARFANSLKEQDPERVTIGKFEVMRFPNKEICVAVREGVENKDCLLIGSIAPPDSQLAEFLMLSDALNRGGARSIQAFLPYMAYARQDKFAPGQSGGIAAIGSLFRAVGIDKVITIDLHSDLDKKLIGLPIATLMPAPALFAKEIQDLNWEDMIVVAPDEGALPRTQALAQALNVQRPIAHLVKQRASIIHLGLVGDVGPHAVVVDDILDSGRTLVSACNMLRQKGVKEVAIAVTHGLFTGEIWKELFSLGITSLFVSDSCPTAQRTEEPQVKIISLKPLMSTVLEAAKKEVRNELIST